MDNIEKSIGRFFELKPGIVSVHLFGSHAKGLAHSGSDVDCAVLFEKDQVPHSLDLIGMQDALSDALHMEVDLVCLNHVSPIISMQIYKYGKVLVKNDSKQYAIYVMNLFTDYCDLKMLRKPMENDILKRKYYG